MSVVGAVAIAATVGAVATAASGRKSTAAPAIVKINETDFKIAVSRVAVAAGRTTFVTGNRGETLHELVILKTSRRASRLGHGSRVSETGRIAETGDLRAGSVRSLTVKLPAGHYALICNIPGHYAAGMHADFTVR